MHKYDSARMKKVVIVGARGYSGLELVRILLRHPNAEIVACVANEAEFALSDYLPESRAAQIPVVTLEKFDTVSAKADTIFLATPAEVSLKLAPRALANGADVIDLSGAFRLGAAEAKE